jgi:hypothetical protein
MADLMRKPAYGLSRGSRITRGWVAVVAIVATCLLLAGCRPSVGIGMSVGVPVGDYGHISIGVGGGRWF